MESLTRHAPPYVVYERDESDSFGDYLYLWYNAPADITELQKAGGLWNEMESDHSGFVARFGVESYNIYVQTDCRIDGGAWQYRASWDSPDFWNDDEDNLPSYLTFAVKEGISSDSAVAYGDYTLSWLVYIEDGRTGFLDPALTSVENEYGDTIYHYDLENHTLGFRCRMIVEYQAVEDGPILSLISDWSPETSIGKNGTQKTLTAPTSIPAPSLETFDLVVMEEDGVQWGDATYYLNIPDNVYDGLLYCCAQEGMFEPYRIESQLRINGGDWTDAYTANPDWIFSSYRSAAPETGRLDPDDIVELRVRLVCSELGLISNWSNVIGNAPSFTASDWAQSELAEADSLDLIPDSLRGADLTDYVTRAEFAAISVRLYEVLSGEAAVVAEENPFTDTTDAEVLKAYNVGITRGTSTTAFSPDVLLNREQAATMLTRVYKKVTIEGWEIGKDADFAEEFLTMFTMPAPFADDAKISDWAKSSVYFMAANAIIKGIGDNTFAPRAITSAEEAAGYAQATREQAIAMATRIVKNLA